MTVSYGHGLAVSPLHLATAYASLMNGGHRVRPTLIDGAGPVDGERVVSVERVSVETNGEGEDTNGAGEGCA